MTNTMLHTIGSSEALELFREYQLAQNFAPTTIRNQASLLRSVERHTGHLVDADVFTLRRYMGREDISVGTKRKIRDALAGFFRFLHEEGIRADDPTTRLPKPKAPKGTPRPFTRAQVEAMLTSGAYFRTRVMIMLGYFQGFRVSQIARVHGHDIDLMTMTIRTVGKGNKEGRLPLHPAIAAIAPLMPRDGYWFPARGGRAGHIHGASVTQRITLAKQRAGILDPKLTPHSLRHSFGTDLVEAEVDIRVVQELMMHESLSTTQIYTRVSEQRKTEAVGKLTALPLPMHSGRGSRAAA